MFITARWSEDNERDNKHVRSDLVMCHANQVDTLAEGETADTETRGEMQVREKSAQKI